MASTNPSWRDTLFYWTGEIESERANSSEIQNGIVNLLWIGERLNIPNCPDARSGATPSRNSSATGNVKFSLKGSLNTETGMVSLTSGSWDYAGEGGTSAKERKQETYQDASHELSIPFDKKGWESTEGIVVGKGFNTFGAFIEVGWRSGRHWPIWLTLVRRYLHDGDERASWSCLTLRTQIHYGVAPLLDGGPWNRVMCFTGFGNEDDFEDQGADPYDDDAPLPSPWRSLVLHSARWRQLTLRDERGILRKASKSGLKPIPSSVAPPLLMPTQDGQPFRLRAVRTEHRSYFMLDPIWACQCWGCGGPCPTQNRLKFKAEEWLYDDEILGGGYNFGEYCSRGCIGRAVPELASQSAAWRNDNADGGRHLVMIAAVFWNSLDFNSTNRMRNAGWQQGENRFQMILGPERPSSSSDEDDDSDDDSVSSSDY